MRKSNHSLSLVLILVLVLVLVLTAAVLAGCNGIAVPNNTNIGNNGDDIGGEVGDNPETVETSLAPTVEPLAYSVNNSDESQMMDCDEFVTFDVTSSAVITNENINSFVSVTDRDGASVAVEVLAYDNDIYVVKRPDGENYKAGATYKIQLLDEAATFTGKSADLKQIQFTIYKEYTADAVLQEGIVVVKPQNVSTLSAGLKDADNDVYGIRLELIVPYDVSSEQAAIDRFAVGTLFVIANSLDEVTPESFFGKVTSQPLTVQGGGMIVVVFDYVAPSVDEIYQALNIYKVDEFDCSEVEISSEAAEAVSASIKNSEMFYNFADAVYREANAAGIADTVTGFLDNFKVASEITHEGKGFKVAFSIEYLSDPDEYGKCMYAKVAYGGIITYDIKVNAELEGTSFYYDYALIVNTDHALTISIQWIDSESDTIVLNDEELAAKIANVLQNRNTISGTVFGDAKPLSKEFTVPLIQTLTYVIPETPITINLDLNWFLSLGVQAELFNDTTITTSDTIGVRSVANEEGDLLPVPYQTRTVAFTNDTMLFGTLTLATGVNADVYFSIVGMAKWLRVGVDARVGVYLELDGVFAKTEASDDNIKTAAGEFGWFASAALEYKVFVLSGKPAGVEVHGSFFTFGQDIITLGWDDAVSNTIALNETVTPVDTDTLLTLNQIDLPAYEPDKSYLTFVNPIEVDTTWTVMPHVYSVEDFDYNFADSTLATYANGCIVALADHDFTTEMTMTLKEDSGVSKTFTLTYVAPVIEESDEANGQSYTINFNSNGGEVVAAMYNVAHLSTITLPVINDIDGYYFAGWMLGNTVVANAENSYNFMMTATSDITLIAKWSQTKPDYTYISTAAQLKQVRDGLSENYYLLNDINLGGAEWEPVGTIDNPYTGIFDGNNHKIYGFKVTDAATVYAGLFGYTNGTVKNLNVANCTISYTADKFNVTAGVLAAVNNGTIENCAVSSSSVAITMKGSTSEFKAYAGGFVGINKSLIRYTNTASATVSLLTANVNIDLYAAGFAALNEGTISGSCSAYGTPSARNTNSVALSSDTYSAGFVAINAANAAINGAYAYGSYTLVSERQGGLVAENNGSIANCKVAGTFTFTVDNVGGIAGVNYGTVVGCQANCAVKANDESNVGGVVGLSKSGASVTNCSSSGSVIGLDDVGGVIGELEKDSTQSGNSSTATYKATNKGVFGIGAGSAGQIYGNI